MEWITFEYPRYPSSEMKEIVNKKINGKSIIMHFCEAARNLDVAEIKSILEELDQMFDQQIITLVYEEYVLDQRKFQLLIQRLFQTIVDQNKRWRLDPEKEQKMADVLNLLMEEYGADPNFKKIADWGEKEIEYNQASELMLLLCEVKDAKLRLDLLKNFVAYGLQVNNPKHFGDSKYERAGASMTHPIFKMMSELSSQTDPEERKSNEEFIKAVIDSGADVNTVYWRWLVDFRDNDCSGEEEEIDKCNSNKNYTTILQHAISCKFPEVVKLLIQKGAKVNAPHVYFITPTKTEKFPHTKEMIENKTKEVGELKIQVHELEEQKKKLEKEYEELKEKYCMENGKDPEQNEKEWKYGDEGEQPLHQ